MESDSAPPATLLHPKTRPKTLKLTPIWFFILLFCGIFLLRIPATAALDSDPISQFAAHCHPFIPSNFTQLLSSSIVDVPAFQIGFASGGGSLFPQSDSASEFPKSAIFVPYPYSAIVNNSQRGVVLNLRAWISFRIPRSLSAAYQRGGYLNNHRGLRFRVRGPRIPTNGGGLRRVDLVGFWSEPSGRLCMVGSGSRNLGNAGKFNTNNVVLKLTYSKNSSIFGALVSGVLESLDAKADSSYFEPVTILGVRDFHDYNFTLVDSGDENSDLNRDDDERESLSLNEVQGGLCKLIDRRTLRFELEYGSDCANSSCSPLRRDVGYVPSFMFFKKIRCIDKGKMVVLLAFRNSSTLGRSIFPFDPNTTLIAEGAWDEKENRLHGVACRILNFTHSFTDVSVGDCSSKFSMRVLKTMSLRKRGSLVGQIWSNETENDPGNFGRIRFSSVSQLSLGIPGLKYEYSEIDGARKSCAKKSTARLKRKIFPDGYSSDMRFDVSLRKRKGQTEQGYASPIFVGDQLYIFQNRLWYNERPPFQQNKKSDSPLNISYYITFTSDFDFGGSLPVSKDVEISAEGLYNGDTGLLCMIGCRRLGSAGERLMKNQSLDCNITITLQFSPLHSAGIDHVKGAIESTRSKSDPLYFKRIDLSSKSLYSEQAKESIWRMDLEVTMVLVSYTLACVFVGLQLYHLKKHPDVLPFISIVMLIVLTLGNMIPLLLNFEALFLKNRNQQNPLLQSGGWLEVNEIIVRMVTMVAFLLQFWLLQLTWSARQSSESETGLWSAEKMVVYASLPFYISGGLIAWFIHLWKNSTQSPFLGRHLLYMADLSMKPLHQQSSLWTALRSYGGLILDGFLLPQIAFNIFSNSNKQALTAFYYIGATLVRLLPHAYDLYRAHSDAGSLDFSYIYANHKMDFYSTAWNIIIPFSGLLFAVLVFLQQSFGGRCFLPRQFRDPNAYEKVASVELQGESAQNGSDSL